MFPTCWNFWSLVLASLQWQGWSFSRAQRTILWLKEAAISFSAAESQSAGGQSDPPPSQSWLSSGSSGRPGSNNFLFRVNGGVSSLSRLSCFWNIESRVILSAVAGRVQWGFSTVWLGMSDQRGRESHSYLLHWPRFIAPFPAVLLQKLWTNKFFTITPAVT